MPDYVLSCCSTSDLTKEHLEQRNINCCYFHYQLDGKDFLDDLGQTISSEEFYNAMTNGADTKTSQINSEEYINYFEPILKEGKDILHVCLSSGLSGTINSANVARDMLKESYPDRNIYVVDSLGASSGLGLFVETLADLRDSGMPVKELYEWAKANCLKLHHWFFSTDLTFYIKGGRISKTSGTIAGILGICPLLNMDYEGHLMPRDKIRSKAKVIHEIVKRMELHAQGGHNYNQKCFISHSNCYKDAQKVAELVEATFPKLNGRVLINNIGTTIGSHTGPGTVALFFWGDERID